MSDSEILKNLRNAVLEFEPDKAEAEAKEAVEAGIDPLKAADALIKAIREIGEGFGRGELFIPDLVGGAEAMKAAMGVIEEEIRRRGGKKESLGTIVAGTVFGDIHDIGKALVCTLLIADGFEVHDLGVDLPAEEFVKAVREYQPDILAMSALLTTTTPELRKVIEALEKEGLRDKVKIIVGGAPVNQDLANEIGADGYKPTAIRAPELVRTLLGIFEM